MNIENSVSQKYWHVIYTRSRAEKKVCEELTINNVECYVPLKKTLRQWKDRKKWIEVPLISGYCFVLINRKEYDKVLQTDNVVCYVTFEGKAAIIPDCQIESLKRMLNQNDFEVSVTNDNFEVGKKVEVISGPLIGLRGELEKTRGSRKFIIRFTQINSSFSVEIPASQISYLPSDSNS